VLFIFQPDAEKVFQFNDAGMFVLKHVDGKRSVGAIIEAIRSSVENAPRTASRDVVSFFDRLASEKFGLRFSDE
jgi:hypothetical protein